MKVDEIVGQIEAFELPGAWLAEEPVDLGESSTRIFRLVENTEIIFGYHYSSYPLTRSASKAFQTTLYSQFHDLDEAEITALAPVLMALANAKVFTVDNASTDYLNDRRVIKVVGRWLEPERTTISFFLDVFGQGQCVQNLFFTTPSPLFTTSSTLAESILSSIKWVAREN